MGLKLIELSTTNQQTKKWCVPLKLGVAWALSLFPFHKKTRGSSFVTLDHTHDTRPCLIELINLCVCSVKGSLSRYSTSRQTHSFNPKNQMMAPAQFCFKRNKSFYFMFNFFEFLESIFTCQHSIRRSHMLLVKCAHQDSPVWKSTVQKKKAPASCLLSRFRTDRISHARLRLFLVSQQRPTNVQPSLQGEPLKNKNKILNKIFKFPALLPLLFFVDWWTCRIVRFLHAVRTVRGGMESRALSLFSLPFWALFILLFDWSIIVVCVSIASSSSVRYFEDDPTGGLRWRNVNSSMSTRHGCFDPIGPIWSSRTWSGSLLFVF